MHTETQNSSVSRALFIDFDGVLHPSTAIEHLDKSLPLSVLAKEPGLFRWTGLLADLMQGHEDVMLFVHSSWRFDLANEDMKRVLGPLERFFAGPTNTEQRNRLMSIETLVQRAGIDHYLVLDDARSEFPADYAELVLCNPLLGVSDGDVLTQIQDWLRRTRAHELN